MTGTLLGRDCAVANLVYAVSKMKYKNGTGDPSGFKLWIVMSKIPPGTFVRYVGNRLLYMCCSTCAHLYLNTKRV